MLAEITSGSPITWGDLLIVLAVLALLVIIFGWAPWRRR
jgi:hypothetical protein